MKPRYMNMTTEQFINSVAVKYNGTTCGLGDDTSNKFIDGCLYPYAIKINKDAKVILKNPPFKAEEEKTDYTEYELDLSKNFGETLEELTYIWAREVFFDRENLDDIDPIVQCQKLFWHIDDKIGELIEERNKNKK